MTDTQLLDEDMFKCPYCKRVDDVILPVTDHALCTRCGTIWELEDEDKRGYICPTHKVTLHASVGATGVRMYCDVCKAFYVIPDTLNAKLKRAFIRLEELP